MQHFLALFLFLAPLWTSASGALLAEGPPVSPWGPVENPAPVSGASDIRHEHWTSQRPPAGAYDRIGLHRYRGPEPAESVMLYFPGTFMNGEVTGLSENHDFFLFLARRGVDVYALDYRSHAVPPEAPPGEEPVDLSFMAAWGMEAFTADGSAALAFVRSQSEGLPVFVGGFSRGVAFAYAVAAANPDAVRGIVALDGFFKRAIPQGAAIEEDSPADPAAALAAGKRWAHDVGGSRGWTMRQSLMEAAAADPSSPAFGAEGAVGEQLAGILHNAWGPGVLANPVRGKDGSGGGVSDIVVLARLMAGYDRYYPLLQDLEAAAWGDVSDHPGTPIDDGWPTLRKPVFFVGSTGMGVQFLIDGLASAAQSAQDPPPEIHILEGHGHLDILVGERARTDVFEPMLEWIRRTAREKP